MRMFDEVIVTLTHTLTHTYTQSVPLATSIGHMTLVIL